MTEIDHGGIERCATLHLGSCQEAVAAVAITILPNFAAAPCPPLCSQPSWLSLLSLLFPLFLPLLRLLPSLAAAPAVTAAAILPSLPLMWLLPSLPAVPAVSAAAIPPSLLLLQLLSLLLQLLML